MALPILPFLIARMQEYDGTFELREGTPFHKLYFQPLEFIVQPFAD